MSFNGSGTFVINSTGQPVVTGTVISSTAFNALTADLATGLSTTITKNGQTTPTANLPMGGFKFTGMADGTAGTDSATLSQIQSAYGTFLTVLGINTITATVSPSLTAYSAGQMFGFVAVNTNTGATTINISGLGAKSIVTPLGTLNSGDIQTGDFYIIYYDGTNFQLLGVSTATVNLSVSGVLTLSGTGVQMTSSGTGAWKMPVGTTGQRPTGASGLIRLNSTTGNPEWYDATTSAWSTFSQPAGYSVNYLIASGGGGGGGGSGGGGGAGGLLTGTTSLSAGVPYTITIGSGGAGGATNTNGTIGVVSSALTISPVGGGYGQGSVGVSGGSGGPGGSGGGGFGGGGGSGTGGTGTSGQGSSGGNGATQTAGGGGGSSAVGGNAAASSAAGAGGAGTSNSISGTPVTYAGGGGGGSLNGAVGAGGAGGGGAGGFAGVGVAATVNTGSGGGGGGGSTGNFAGGNGGSGIVIISYLGSQRGTGGTVTSSGGYTIHTFTSSSTYNA